MSVTERSSTRKSVIRLPEVSEITLLVAIAIGFLVLHFLTATLLMPAATADAAAPQEARAVHTD
ncbi:hypothetical protein [Bradyrhizobium sp. RD5-C2]|jgi:hypothetical protein|uniref:hypothetical protein n=1 Tax=Bradyrhizobium sp. RD5-C2 TaxID=244562 RepID=UPI001CC6B982|nr:hypothetical protein [Bradyrhizobium sp. RD5-C2]GIQ77711.1 hypothetical protein BraRD5C2_61610 [Bradyrhizobium sp. RD5-C2]